MLDVESDWQIEHSGKCAMRFTEIFCAALACLGCGKPRRPGAGMVLGCPGVSTRGPVGLHWAGLLDGVDAGSEIRNAVAVESSSAAATKAAGRRAILFSVYLFLLKMCIQNHSENPRPAANKAGIAWIGAYNSLGSVFFLSFCTGSAHRYAGR